MQVIAAIFFFICLSFIIVIAGLILLAMYLKRKVIVFKQVQTGSESYQNEPYVDADFHTIGHEEPAPDSLAVTDDDVIDTTYRVIQSNEEDAASSDHRQ